MAFVLTTHHFKWLEYLSKFGRIGDNGRPTGLPKNRDIAVRKSLVKEQHLEEIGGRFRLTESGSKLLIRRKSDMAAYKDLHQSARNNRQKAEVEFDLRSECYVPMEDMYQFLEITYSEAKHREYLKDNAPPAAWKLLDDEHYAMFTVVNLVRDAVSEAQKTSIEVSEAFSRIMEKASTEKIRVVIPGTAKVYHYPIALKKRPSAPPQILKKIEDLPPIEIPAPCMAIVHIPTVPPEVKTKPKKPKAPRKPKKTWNDVFSIAKEVIGEELVDVDPIEKRRMLVDFKIEIDNIVKLYRSKAKRVASNGIKLLPVNSSRSSVVEACRTLDIKCPKIRKTPDMVAAHRKFKVLARTYHPDKNPGNPHTLKLYRDVCEAIQVLEKYEESLKGE